MLKDFKHMTVGELKAKLGEYDDSLKVSFHLEHYSDELSTFGKFDKVKDWLLIELWF